MSPSSGIFIDESTSHSNNSQTLQSLSFDFSFEVEKIRKTSNNEMFLPGDPPLSLTLEKGKAVFPRHAVLWSKAVEVRLDGDLHGSGWLSSLGL